MDGTDTGIKEIQQRNIETELRESYLEYSLAVIVGRAIPDARDGLYSERGAGRLGLDAVGCWITACTHIGIGLVSRQGQRGTVAAHRTGVLSGGSHIDGIAATCWPCLDVAQPHMHLVAHTERGGLHTSTRSGVGTSYGAL